MRCACGETLRFQFIGWRKREGVLCMSCNLYHPDSGREPRLVLGIKKRGGNFIFESDLRFDTKRKSAFASKPCRIIKRVGTP